MILKNVFYMRVNLITSTKMTIVFDKSHRVGVTQCSRLTINNYKHNNAL